MKIMKQFGLAAALCVAVALGSVGTAFADNNLTPPPDSPSPGASGSATTKWYGPYMDWSSGVTYWVADTRVHVKGLQPNTAYVVIAYFGYGSGGSGFKTANNGAGAARFTWTNDFPAAYYEVYLVNPDGSWGAIVLSSWQ